MAIDEDSRDPKTNSQHHAQGAIHSPHIQKRPHVGSGVRRFAQKFPEKAAKHASLEFTPL
jgi:hypothetical protein